MSTGTEKKQLKPYHGIGIFIFFIVVFPFIAVPIQAKWGMYGLAVTELLILLFALIPALILKADLKEVFPLKWPKFRQIIGVFFLWSGSFIIVLLVSLIIEHFFPGIKEVSNAIYRVTTSVPMAIAFAIMAVMPAICEEAFHRGFILSSLASIKSKWVVILLMGFIFGVFHLDFYRFLQTAILGGVLTYIMIESGNMALPILFHLINNAVPTLASFSVVPPDTAMTKVDLSAAIPGYLILGSIVPFLLLIGSALVREKSLADDAIDIDLKKKRRRIKTALACVCSVLMLLAGMAAMVAHINRPPAFETSVSMNVNYNSDDLHIPMKLKSPGEYMFNLEINCERGMVDFEIVDDSGKVIYQTSCSKLTSNGLIQLENTTYTINVDFLMDMKEIDEYYVRKGYDYSDSLKDALNLNGNPDDMTSFEMSLIIR